MLKKLEFQEKKKKWSLISGFYSIELQYISKKLIMELYLVYFIPNQAISQAFSMPLASSTTLDEPPVKNVPQEPSISIQGEQKLLDIDREDLIKAGYEIKKKVWSEAQDAQLLFLRDKQKLDWAEIAQKLKERNSKMCYSRYRRLQSRTKIVWSQAQDRQLCEMVEKYGQNWEYIAQFFEKRNIKQVKERYVNYLHPNINKDRWDLEEDFKLVNLINKYGLEWKQIEPYFIGRTQNQLKNRYFGRLKRISDKKMMKKLKEGSDKEQSEKNLG